MSRTPQQILTELDKSSKAQTDRIERYADERMDSSYTGGDFVYIISEKVNESTREELSQRYSGWSLSFACNSEWDPKEQQEWFSTTITFSLR